MDNAPDSGPEKKPTPRTTSRPAGARKPAAPRASTARTSTARKPAAKTPARPPKPPVDEAVESLAEEVAETAVVEAAETEAAESEAETAATEAAASAPRPASTPRAGTKRATKPAASKPAAAAPVVKPAEPGQAEPRTGAVAVREPLRAGTAVAKKRSSTVLSVKGLTKSFDDTLAVSGIDLEVEVGAFYGIVGPNGAGKTTTLSMITGLLRPDSGTVAVNGSDVWTDTVQAKRMMGVLPDRLRLFDRLTGAQLLYYAGVLRGLDNAVVRERTADLAHAFGIEQSLGRLVSDYSAGMTKKIALAAAMIHSPRLLVLDEPFESVDPVSAATVTEILKKYVAAGGTVVLSSHSMDLVQRICDHVAVVVRGEILADGTVAEVRDGQTLEERFVELAGGRTTVEGLEWLHSFSD